MGPVNPVFLQKSFTLLLQLTDAILNTYGRNTSPVSYYKATKIIHGGSKKGSPYTRK
jgi:hypothetical protein